MRTTWAGVLLSLLAVVGCDTDDPLGADEQSFAVTVQANAAARIVDIWDIEQEVNGERIPLDTKRCVLVPLPDIVPNTLVPWAYTLEVAVIPAGETTEEIIATSVGAGVTDYSNVAPYDEEIIQTLLPFQSGEFFFVNGRRMSTGSRDYLEGCLGRVLPDANILGEPEEFRLPIGQGDTVIVRGRKQLLADASADSRFIVTQAGQRVQPFSDPSLNAFVFLDGTSVSPAGTSSAGIEDGSGVSFSFTLR